MKLVLVATYLIAIAGITHVNTMWAKSVEESVKNWIDESSKSLKKGVDELGDDFRSIQDYLDNYHWKGLVQERATSGPVTLKHLEMNGHSKAVVAKPGERIEAEIQCNVDPAKTSSFAIYRAVIGINGKGPQAVVGTEAGLTAGKTLEKFDLIAPAEAGVYQVRFRTADAFFESTARDAWKDKNGNEPDGTTTIGIIIVK